MAENYPELRATENFQQLQPQPLRARGRDPGLAPDLQLQRPVLQHEDPAVFPSSIVANQGGFTAREFFEIEDAADREVVEVKF